MGLGLAREFTDFQMCCRFCLPRVVVVLKGDFFYCVTGGGLICVRTLELG